MAAERLHKFRSEKGALEFESIESSAVMENGEVKGIVSVTENSARKLIENFMVAANVEMAEFLEGHGCVSLRRVVKTPQHWEGIREIAEKSGVTLPDAPDARALAEFLVDQRHKRSSSFPRSFPSDNQIDRVRRICRSAAWRTGRRSLWFRCA